LVVLDRLFFSFLQRRYTFRHGALVRDTGSSTGYCLLVKCAFTQDPSNFQARGYEVILMESLESLGVLPKLW